MAGKKKAANNAALGAASGGLGGRTNLGLGPLRGALNSTTRQNRMDSYLSSATGEKPKAKKKGR